MILSKDIEQGSSMYLLLAGVSVLLYALVVSQNQQVLSSKGLHRYSKCIITSRIL